MLGIDTLSPSCKIPRWRPATSDRGIYTEHAYCVYSFFDKSIIYILFLILVMFFIPYEFIIQCLIVFSLFCQLCASLSFSSKLSSHSQVMIGKFKFHQLTNYSIMNSRTTHVCPQPPPLSRYSGTMFIFYISMI